MSINQLRSWRRSRACGRGARRARRPLAGRGRRRRAARQAATARRRRPGRRACRGLGRRSRSSSALGIPADGVIGPQDPPRHQALPAPSRPHGRRRRRPADARGARADRAHGARRRAPAASARWSGSRSASPAATRPPCPPTAATAASTSSRATWGRPARRGAAEGRGGEGDSVAKCGAELPRQDRMAAKLLASRARAAGPTAPRRSPPAPVARASGSALSALTPSAASPAPRACAAAAPARRRRPRWRARPSSRPCWSR